MRLMDARYKYLSLEQLKVRIDQAGDRPVELFGWFDGGTDVANLRQVLGIASDAPVSTPRADTSIEMLGIAKDVIGGTGDAEVLEWYGRFLLRIRELVSDLQFTAIRPVSMTWKPMQRLHDHVVKGTVVTAPDGGRWRISIQDERLQEDVVIWQLKIKSAP